jgi:nicotinate phosphoribosyltransferase
MERLWQKDAPVIRSLLETDVYKIYMLYMIWKFFPNLHVRFAFKNRTTSVRLADEVDFDALKDQIRAASQLRFEERDIAHIRSWKKFPEEFLQALLQLRLPEISLEKGRDGQLLIIAIGLWFAVTLWELIVLPIVSEMRTRFVIGEQPSDHQRVIRSGEARLLAKLPVLRELLPLKLSLFDLRRRASGDWERHTTEMLLNEIPELISGTSNVWLARELGLNSDGTNAHELPMAITALRSHEGPDAMRDAQYEVLRKWQSLYGYDSLIMLGDTFGDEQFFQGLGENFFRDWRGSRHDSGDPYAYGEARILDYNRLGIDPTRKVIIYSDALTPEVMLGIKRKLFERIGLAYGWGTNKSHDLGVPCLGPLSSVMKLDEAAGQPAVKLSANIAKATGDRRTIEYYKKVFRYDVTFNETPTY